MTGLNKLSFKNSYKEIFVALLLVLVTITGAVPAQAGEKIALVIGNSAYRYASPLKNPRNDAAFITDRLQELGFKTFGGIDLTHDQFVSAVEKFTGSLQDADVGLFYYSGHGFQLEGENYLLPIDTNITSTSSKVKTNLVSLNYVLETMTKVNKTNLLFIDACRNNPYITEEARKQAKAISGKKKKKKSRKKKKKQAGTKGLARIEEGLAQVRAGAGTMITFATQPGNVALDGEGENSPFTEALLKHISVPEIDLPEMLRRVRADVIEATSGKQVPWSNSSMLVNYYFTSPPDKARKDRELETLRAEIDTLKNRLVAGRTTNTQDLSADRKALIEKIEELQKREKEQRDEAAFSIARLSDTIAAYESYMSLHTDGRHKGAATKRIDELQSLGKVWKSLRKAKGFANLDRFVSLSAGTEFHPLAAQRRSSLEQSEREDWEETETDKTAGAYKSFLKRWPDGRQSEIAAERIDELARIGVLWDKIKNTEDLSVLREFIDEHGWSEYGAEAVAVMASLINPLKPSAEADNIKVLDGKAIASLVNGKTLVIPHMRAEIKFNSRSVPRFRKRLGRKFLTKQINVKSAAEGAFESSFMLKGKKHTIQGIGTIIISHVDATGSMFLMQMYGKERRARDVDQRDRKYFVLNMVKYPHGYTCIGTDWAYLAAGKKPRKFVEECNVE